MARTDGPRDEQFWNALNFGALLVSAAVISVTRYALSGHWPADLGGWGAAGFAVAGLALLGRSLTHRSAARQSVKQ